MDRVRGKVAVVTGAALGIGRATCRLLAREGAMVAITDVLDAAGQQVAAEISGDGGTARYWHLDVSNEAEVSKVFDEVKTAFGKLDVLVNNAGIGGHE